MARFYSGFRKPSGVSLNGSNKLSTGNGSRSGLLSKGERSEHHRNGNGSGDGRARIVRPRTTATEPARKRFKAPLDFAIIIMTLPLWLPAMLIIAAWIKITSPGPAFYRQRRIGYFGKEFFIIKFRTMNVDAETDSHERHLVELIEKNCPMTKLDAVDPRLIPGGGFLRASGLDELPQIFNVLQREMSIVGPRPCTPHEFARYHGWQKERVNALPGLTGYWQTHGKNRTTFSEMIAMDLYYVRRSSLILDLAIIARTIPVLLGQLFERRQSTRVAVAAPAAAKTSVEGNNGGSAILS